MPKTTHRVKDQQSPSQQSLKTKMEKSCVCTMIGHGCLGVSVGIAYLVIDAKDCALDQRQAMAVTVTRRNRETFCQGTALRSIIATCQAGSIVVEGATYEGLLLDGAGLSGVLSSVVVRFCNARGPGMTHWPSCRWSSPGRCCPCCTTAGLQAHHSPAISHHS